MFMQYVSLYQNMHEYLKCTPLSVGFPSPFFMLGTLSSIIYIGYEVKICLIIYFKCFYALV